MLPHRLCAATTTACCSRKPVTSRGRNGLPHPRFSTGCLPGAFPHPAPRPDTRNFFFQVFFFVRLQLCHGLEVRTVNVSGRRLGEARPVEGGREGASEGVHGRVRARGGRSRGSPAQSAERWRGGSGGRRRRGKARGGGEGMGGDGNQQARREPASAHAVTGPARGRVREERPVERANAFNGNPRGAPPSSANLPHLAVSSRCCGLRRVVWGVARPDTI